MADNAEILRSLYEAWNRRDFDMLSQYCTPDTVITVMGSGETYRGVEGNRRYNQEWADAFPDGRITVDRIVASGGTVVAEFTGRGTHTGPLAAPGGTIPATGRSVTLHLCDVVEFEDGNVVQQHSYLDAASLLSQLGLMAPQPTEATS